MSNSSETESRVRDIQETKQLDALITKCNRLYEKAGNMSETNNGKKMPDEDDEESPFVVAARIENAFHPTYNGNAKFILTLCDRSCEHKGQDCDCSSNDDDAATGYWRLTCDHNSNKKKNNNKQAKPSLQNKDVVVECAQCTYEDFWDVTSYSAELTSSDASMLIRFSCKLPKSIVQHFAKKLSELYCWRVVEMKRQHQSADDLSIGDETEHPVMDIHLDTTETGIGRVDVYQPVAERGKQVTSFDLSTFALTENELYFRARCL